MPEELSYLTVHALLESYGLPVPATVDVDGPRGIVLQEDLGVRTLQDDLKDASAARREELYREAVDEIARLQMKAAQGPQKLDCFRVAFDIEKLSWELHYFLKHFLEGHRGCDLTVEDRATLSEAFHELSREIASWPRVLCHRDYHSRNLMPHAERLYWIDFQDARMGPTTYDLASLLRDAYVDVPEELQEDLKERFRQTRDAGRAARGLPPPLRPHVRAAQPEGAGHLRLHGDGAEQPGVPALHPAQPRPREAQPVALPGAGAALAHAPPARPGARLTETRSP